MTNTMLVLVNLKIAAMKQIKEYPATFHAIDLALRIAGWEEASVKGDKSFELHKKVQQILEEELHNMRGY